MRSNNGKPHTSECFSTIFCLSDFLSNDSVGSFRRPFVVYIFITLLGAPRKSAGGISLKVKCNEIGPGLILT